MAKVKYVGRSAVCAVPNIEQEFPRGEVVDVDDSLVDHLLSVNGFELVEGEEQPQIEMNEASEPEINEEYSE